MVERIRAHDWTSTPLGPIATWSQALRSTVDMLVVHGFPMVVLWGPDLVQVYNDGYRLLMGSKHPDGLGQPTRNCWPEVWHINAPIYDRVWAGETVTFQDALYPITRHGPLEDAWFTLTYSPLRDDGGGAAGVLVTVFETTERHLAEKRREESEAIRRVALAGGRMGSWRWDLAMRQVSGDAQFLSLWGIPPSQDPLPLSTFTDRQAPDGVAQTEAVVTKAVAAGEEFDAEIAVASGPTAGRWLRWRGRVDSSEKSILYGVSFDITEQKRAEAALRESEERQAFLLKLSDALRSLTDSIEITAQAISILGEYMQADRTFIAVMEPDGVNLEVRHEYLRPGASSVVGHHNFDQFGTFVSPRLVAGQILAVDDVATLALTPTERAHYAVVGVAAYLLVPLVRDGRFAACFTCNHQTARPWSEADKNIVRQTADRTWAAVERARAEAALRDSETRLAAAFESVPVGAAVVDLSGAAVIANREFRHFLPTGVVPSLDPVRGTRWQAWDAHGRLLDRHDFPAARALRGESVVPGQEMLYTDDDGRDIWTSVATVPIRDEQGGVTGLVTAIADIDAAKRGSEALRESEERLRQFGEASSDVLWIRDAETFQWTYLTPAFETIYGIDRATALSGDNMAGWVHLIEPEDRERAVESLRHVQDGERVSFEYRIRRRSDGTVRWLRNTDFPIRDDAGAVRSIGGIGRDITEARETAERMNVLVAELQHRTRNLLGVVRAMSDKTIDRSSNLADFRVRYGDRLAALARVQSLLSRLAEGERLTFDELIRGELAALVGESDQVTLNGPRGVELRSSTVQTFALALHELVTNAIKYGAFSQPDGRLEVRWRLESGTTDSKPWLRIDWRERGVAMPAKGAAPRGGGSGRELIERALPYQLKAKTTFVMEEDGVHCTIALATSDRSQSRKPIHA